MISEPNVRKPQIRLGSAFPHPVSITGWLSRVTGRFSVSQKISYGYGLTLGIAVLGTAAGFMIGDYYQQRATKLHEYSNQELNLLHRLQNGVLQARTHQQQLIPLAENPELFWDEYSHFLEHTAEIKRILSQIKSYTNSAVYQREAAAHVHADGIPSFLKTYENVPEIYFHQVDELVQQIELSHLKPDKIQEAQKLLLNFTNGSVALNFDGLSDDLTGVIQGSYQDVKQAELALIAAETIRFKIIVASILLSIAIAILLAIYTSRAIVRPLKAATDVAQRATQESNFGLQVPITTEDEVGMLATSLNQLILQVGHLLQEQKADSELRLIQSEKMSSLGRMLAGVAHEINNPVNFIYGNLAYAGDYVKELLALLETYQAEIPNPPETIQTQAEEIDIDFLKQDLPKVLQSMKVGSDRVRQIVLSLKDFSRLDDPQPNSVDLHACLDSTLLILNNRIKNNINIIQNYGDIPAIEGYTGLLYQVFMNLLSNAIDALEEAKEPGEIVISTERLNKDTVGVRIADNGSGISPEHQEKIFDAFFTTKPRGIGTGLGLSISHQIIVEKHGGNFSCKSEVGKGTELAIALPIKHQVGVASTSTTKILC